MGLVNEKTLRVPGADLFYRTQGAGPLLLLIQGGAGDADGTHGIAGHLVEHYTVLSYDRRGLSRSTLDDPAEVPGIGTHADDVHRLLASLTSEPVAVFGTSFGAYLGLELVARHSEQVKVLVAHEPPATQFLPDEKETLARLAAISSDEEAAAMLGLDFDEHEPGVEFPPPTPRQEANEAFFRARDARAVAAHRFDEALLRAARAQVLPAAGATSGTAFACRCAEELARLLGNETVYFPGSHVGLISHPAAFAAKLREVLCRRGQLHGR
jgi:pimeloyl-ACP methyl ester carboxylesterase